MLALRAAVAGAVIILSTLAAATAACVTAAPQLRNIAETPTLVPGPAAWTGFFLIASSHSEPGQTVWIALYTEEGLEIAAPREILPFWTIGPLALAWNGSEAALFYKTADDLFLQRLSAEGNPIGEPIVVESEQRVSPGEALDVAWSASHGAWLVGRRRGSDPSFYSMLVAPDGTVLVEELFAFERDGTVRAAVTAGGVAGVFASGREGKLRYSRVGPAKDEVFIVPAVGGDFVLAARGEEFVFLQAREDGGHTSIHYFTVDAQSAEVSAAVELIDNGGGLIPLSVVARQDEIALAYLDAPDGFDAKSVTYRVRRFAPDGSFIADTDFGLGEPGLQRHYSEWPMAWTGSAYVNVVGRGVVPDKPGTFLYRLCPLEASIEAPLGVRVGATVAFSAVVDGGFGEYEHLWNFGDRNSSKQAAPEHVYDKPGTYTLRLTVEDATGTMVERRQSVIVGEGKRRAARH